MEELKKIRAALAAGIAKAALAERAGVAKRVLADIDTPGFNPTLETLTKLARAAEELASEQIERLKGVA